MGVVKTAGGITAPAADHPATGWHLVKLVAALIVLRILRRLLSPRHRLIDAINNREIEVHYQPIVALCSGKLVGAEALMRWPQPDGSNLSPNLFVPLAEQTGLISKLTQLVVNEVFEDLGAGCTITRNCTFLSTLHHRI